MDGHRDVIGLVNRGQPLKPDDWGTLRAWAWGASRGLDYLEALSAVRTPSTYPWMRIELIALCAPRLTFVSYGVPEKGDAKWLDRKGSAEKMPPFNMGLLDGQLAWLSMTADRPTALIGNISLPGGTSSSTVYIFRRNVARARLAKSRSKGSGLPRHSWRVARGLPTLQEPTAHRDSGSKSLP